MAAGANACCVVQFMCVLLSGSIPYSCSFAWLILQDLFSLPKVTKNKSRKSNGYHKKNGRVEGLKCWTRSLNGDPPSTQVPLKVLCLSSATHLWFALPVAQCFSWAVSIQCLNSGHCCMVTTVRPPRKQVLYKLVFPSGGKN